MFGSLCFAKLTFLEGVGLKLIKSFYIQNQVSKTREKILSVSYKRDAYCNSADNPKGSCHGSMLSLIEFHSFLFQTHHHTYPWPKTNKNIYFSPSRIRSHKVDIVFCR